MNIEGLDALDNKILEAVKNNATFRPKLFDDSIRELILETLCMYVGMDLEVFCDGCQETIATEKIAQEKKFQRPWDLKVGEQVIVISGVWSDTEGEIISVNEPKETIVMNVNLFGRTTPIEIPISEIKKK